MERTKMLRLTLFLLLFGLITVNWYIIIPKTTVRKVDKKDIMDYQEVLISLNNYDASRVYFRKSQKTYVYKRSIVPFIRTKTLIDSVPTVIISEER